MIKESLEILSVLYNEEYVIGDIKPENTMLSKNKIRFIDYGFVEYFDEDIHLRRGTPIYMAPECFQNTNMVLFPNDKKDIWAYGMMICTVLTDENPQETIMHTENDDISPVFEFENIDKMYDKIKTDFWSTKNLFYYDKTVLPMLEDFILKCLTFHYRKRPSVFKLLDHELFNIIK